MTATLGSSEWPISDLRGRLPLHFSAPSTPMSCLQNVFSVAVQANWYVIIPTWCFGCGSSNIETGAAQEAYARKHPPYWSSTYSLELSFLVRKSTWPALQEGPLYEPGPPQGLFLVKRVFLCHYCLWVRLWVSVDDLETILIVADYK